MERRASGGPLCSTWNFFSLSGVGKISAECSGLVSGGRIPGAFPLMGSLRMVFEREKETSKKRREQPEAGHFVSCTQGHKMSSCSGALARRKIRAFYLESGKVSEDDERTAGGTCRRGGV